MNLNPMRLFRRKSNDMTSSALARTGDGMGIWQGSLSGFVPRQVNPAFYSALRQALGPLDGGIDRLTTMDGIISVEGDNDKLTQLIEREFLRAIPVNDMEHGFQAFFGAQGDMMLEQGSAVGEMVMDPRGKELLALRVADTRGIVFRRNGTQLDTWYRACRPSQAGRRDGTDAIETVIRNNGVQQPLTDSYLIGHGFTLLNPATMIYAGYNAHADNPYGVSIMRSIEFVSQLLVRIQNATGLAWDRFGDPMFHVLYKTKNRTLRAGEDINKRRDTIAADFKKVLEAKRSGNSADFVQAVGADDDVVINIIGKGNDILQMEVPARHMLDQVLSKFGLPSWMLGVEVRVSGSMGDQQSEMVIQASKTRFQRRLPGLERIVETWLRGRGRTWKPGDWRLTQTLPNLYDELKRSQAGFLQAQTQMMLRGGMQQGVPAGNLPGNDGGMGNVAGTRATHALGMDVPLGHGMHMRTYAHSRCSHRKAGGNDGSDDTGDDQAEPWADNDPALPRIESAAIDALQSDWKQLYARVVESLGLIDSERPTWRFDAAEMLQKLAADQEWFIQQAGSVEGPYLQQVFASWVRGIVNGTAEIGGDVLGDAAIEQVLDQLRSSIAHRQLAQVRNTTVRTFAGDILQTLQRGVYDGRNPASVAADLERQFGLHDYDWLRLARSEIASANAKGKLQSYIRNGYREYDFRTAPGACPICIGLEAAGPYMLGAGPMPMDDSHPNCRCTILARRIATPPARI